MTNPARNFAIGQPSGSPTYPTKPPEKGPKMLKNFGQSKFALPKSFGRADFIIGSPEPQQWIQMKCPGRLDITHRSEKKNRSVIQRRKRPCTPERNPKLGHTVDKCPAAASDQSHAQPQGEQVVLSNTQIARRYSEIQLPEKWSHGFSRYVTALPHSDWEITSLQWMFLA